MLKICKLFILITSVLLSVLWPSAAQNNTNSPYTRFGYGELGQRSFGAGRAMGGIGYGLRSPKQINPLNPASYSCMDSMTFIFDFGIAGQLSWFDDGTSRQHDINGNLEYFAMQFPLHRRIAMSAGLLPYSHVGYKFGGLRKENGVTFDENYNGSGSLSEAYAGLSFDLWKKRLAVGANVGYLFGNLTHAQTITMSGGGTGAFNTNRSQEMRVRDIRMNFGLQYTHPFSKTESFTVGLAYTPEKDLHVKSYEIIRKFNGSGSGEITQSDTVSGKSFRLPATYGIGLSYVKQNKLTLSADFSYENWKKMPYFGEMGYFRNRYKVALGGEFIPEHQNKAFFKRVRYRAGLNYGSSYLQMNRTSTNPNGDGYKEMGVSIGFGLPLIDNRSLVNLSFEYLKKRPEVKTNLIDEQYFRFTVNYTFNEFWFFKNKLD